MGKARVRVPKTVVQNFYVQAKPARASQSQDPEQTSETATEDLQMPAYTPLSADWESSNNLMRSLAGSVPVRQPIQAKLTVGQPNDKYEQEADRVASQVIQHIQRPAHEPSKVCEQSSTLLVQCLSTKEDIEKRANYKGGKVVKGTWTELMKKIDEYNQLSSHQEEDSEKRLPLLKDIQMLIKQWVERHPKKTNVIQELHDVYHEASSEKLTLEKKEENFLGGGYVGDVPTLKHPPSKRHEQRGHKELGSQGYKLHVSYANFPENVDKVMQRVLPALSGYSRKVVQDPKKMTGAQANKFMTVYPELTKITHDGVKPYENASTTVKVTYYEAGEAAAESMAKIIEEIMKKEGVKPGGSVPDEEKLNDWTYRRYGSFTGTKVYEIKENILITKSDMGR